MLHYFRALRISLHMASLGWQAVMARPLHMREKDRLTITIKSSFNHLGGPAYSDDDGKLEA